jgi:hypothetical protein
MRALTVVLAVSAALAVPLACTANPAPSIAGPTGIIMVPNTEVVGRNGADVGLHFFDESDNGTEYDARIWHINVGLCDSVELSVTPWSESNGDEESYTTFGVKWAPLAEPEDCMGLAVGVYDLGEEFDDDSEDEHTAIWYIVGSKSLTDIEAGKRPVRFNLGLELADSAWGPYWLKAHVLHPEGATDSPNLFLGLDAEVADWLTILADTNEFEDFSFGARVNPCENLNIDLLSLDGWGHEREFTLGIGYHVTWD